MEEGVLSSEDVKIKVTNITYAFDNVVLLKLLALRGMLVTQAKTDKIKELDNKINAIKD